MWYFVIILCKIDVFWVILTMFCIKIWQFLRNFVQFCHKFACFIIILPTKFHIFTQFYIFLYTFIQSFITFVSSSTLQFFANFRWKLLSPIKIALFCPLDGSGAARVQSLPNAYPLKIFPLKNCELFWRLDRFLHRKRITC